MIDNYNLILIVIIIVMIVFSPYGYIVVISLANRSRGIEKNHKAEPKKKKKRKAAEKARRKNR